MFVCVGGEGVLSISLTYLKIDLDFIFFLFKETSMRIIFYMLLRLRYFRRSLTNSEDATSDFCIITRKFKKQSSTSRRISITIRCVSVGLHITSATGGFASVCLSDCCARQECRPSSSPVTWNAPAHFSLALLIFTYLISLLALQKLPTLF